MLFRWLDRLTDDECRRYTVYTVIIGLVFFGFRVVRFAFVGEDAYISFRYARNLVEGLGLVFNAGERVEGYTNFLWVMLMAVVEAVLPQRVEIASQILGTCSALAVLVLVWRFLRADDTRIPWTSLWACAFLVLHRNFAIWSTGGLETMFFALLVAAGVLFFVRAEEPSLRTGVLISLMFTLAAMTRPEGTMFWALTAGLAAAEPLLRGRRVRWDLLAALAVPFVTLYGGYFLWRWHYYGLPLPNTFYVKVADSVDSLITEPFYHHAAIYLRLYNQEYGLALLIPALPAAVVWLKIGEQRFRETILVSCYLLLYIAYIVQVGADYMEFRFVVHVLPLAAILFARGFQALGERLCYRKDNGEIGSLRLLIAGWALAGLLVTARSGLHTLPPFLSTGFFPLRTWEGFELETKWKLMGEALGKALPPDTRLGLIQIGMIPYFSRLPAIDAIGLVNTAVSLHVKRARGGMPGHQKRIPERDLLKQGADVVIELTEFYHIPSSDPNVISLEVKEDGGGWIYLLAPGRTAQLAGQMRARGATVHLIEPKPSGSSETN